MPITNKALPNIASTSQGFAKYVSIIWKSIIIIGSIFSLFYIAWAALDWIFSGSNPERLKSAKEKLFNSIFGLMILVLSYVIIKALSHITGLEILNPTWPTL